MYMPRQVRVNHLKRGEEMLPGTMTSVAAMSGGPIRHLEVQICAGTRQAVVELRVRESSSTTPPGTGCFRSPYR